MRADPFPVVHYTRINFQPEGTAPTGYISDTGAFYSVQGNLTYGWSINSTATDRNDPGSPSERHDTFIALDRNGTNITWEMAVKTGRYHVVVVSGDPTVDTGAVYKLNVEDQLVIDKVATHNHYWFTGVVDVVVTDGKLTLSNAEGAVSNVVCYIDIISAGEYCRASAV